MFLPPVHRERNPFFHTYMTDHDSATFSTSLSYLYWSTILLNIYCYTSNSPVVCSFLMLFWMPHLPLSLRRPVLRLRHIQHQFCLGFFFLFFPRLFELLWENLMILKTMPLRDFFPHSLCPSLELMVHFTYIWFPWHLGGKLTPPEQKHNLIHLLW